MDDNLESDFLLSTSAEDEDDTKIDYNQAIQLTINPRPTDKNMSSGRKRATKFAGGCGIFQLLMVICVCTTANTGDPLLFTIGFLTKNPNYFECNNNE